MVVEWVCDTYCFKFVRLDTGGSDVSLLSLRSNSSSCTRSLIEGGTSLNELELRSNLLHQCTSAIVGVVKGCHGCGPLEGEGA